MDAVLNVLGVVFLIALGIIPQNPELVTGAYRWYQRRRALKIKCKKHPKYKAIRKPQCSCVDCRKMWRARNGK